MTMKILIVDDDRDIRCALDEALKHLGHEVTTAGSGEDAIQILNHNVIDLLLTDFKMAAGMNGIQLMEKVKTFNPDIQMILMTAFSTEDVAFAAGKLGAIQYLPKPLNLELLNSHISKLHSIEKIKEENKRLRGTVDILHESSHLKTFNPVMQRVIDTCKLIAKKNSTVLITGESGTGKSMLAKLIHEESDRVSKPFVIVNCAALSENLLESEIFGHVRGSFTGAVKDKLGRFEAAEGGTIFLDEIGEISANLQVKLLRFLQDREFERVGDNRTIKADVRIIAATNKKLDQAVKDGSFREDLYYRLNVIDVHVPTLKERYEDIEHLADTYLAKAFIINGSQCKPLSSEAKATLKAYPWPGNVRELENALTRASITSTGDVVDVCDLPSRMQTAQDSTQSLSSLEATSTTNLEEMERITIKKVLGLSTSVEEAANILGINPSTLWRKRKKWDI
jgi:DNA-binding NtrC family response regulator